MKKIVKKILLYKLLSGNKCVTLNIKKLFINSNTPPIVMHNLVLPTLLPNLSTKKPTIGSVIPSQRRMIVEKLDDKTTAIPTKPFK